MIVLPAEAEAHQLGEALRWIVDVPDPHFEGVQAGAGSNSLTGLGMVLKLRAEQPNGS